MGKNEKPFRGNNQPKAQPEIKRVAPQILVTLDTTRGQVHVNCNFKDWDQTISMLIDALRASNNQKLAEKKNSVVLAKPSLIVPGA